MREMLDIYYRILPDGKITLNGKEGYTQGNNIYFTISSSNKKTILMEQAALSYFLAENVEGRISVPVPNVNAEWFTDYGEESFMLLYIQDTPPSYRMSPGAQLANFHQSGSEFNFEPLTISSYGKWKELWVDKLTTFETGIESQAQELPNEYHRLLMDFLPYLVGISENAIQYLHESAQDRRYLDTDRGTICFNRLEGEIDSHIVWTDNLVYDHPARDIAEYIRYLICNDADGSAIRTFVEEYESVYPLSVFGWRMVYARLLFPAHLFDFIEKGFASPDPEGLVRLMEKQASYEYAMREFFDNAGVSADSWNIPVVHWL